MSSPQPPSRAELPARCRTDRAGELADFSAMIDRVGHGIRRCRRSGLDPASYAGFIGAAYALAGTSSTGSPIRAYIYGTVDSLIAQAWHNDQELAGYAADLEAWFTDRARAVEAFTAECEAALEYAQQLLRGGPEDQGRGRRLAADAGAALEIAAPASARLRHALIRIQAVPEHLGERYAAAYGTVHRGHVIPHDGRFLTGENPSLETGS